MNVDITKTNNDVPTTNNNFHPSQSTTTTVLDEEDQQQQHEQHPNSSTTTEITTPPHHNLSPQNILKSFFKRTHTLFTHLSLSELSGSLGDLGTLIPLLVALSRQRSILLAPSLFLGGLCNLITGYIWDVPMCVQPMKSIAAVALSSSSSGEVGLSKEEVTAAGVSVGAMVFVLGVSGWMEWVNAIVPMEVVSGIQVGIGMRLAGKGVRSVQALEWWGEADCVVLGVVLAGLCLYCLREESVEENDHQQREGEEQQEGGGGSWCQRLYQRCFSHSKKRRKHPVGLYLFFIGVIFATIELSTTKNNNKQYDLPLRLFGAPIIVWSINNITTSDWKTGVLEGALPQLPLTTLNSVISVCALAHTLYPEKRKQTSRRNTKNDAVVSRRDMAISVGLMNLLLCPLGSMPNCHGAGGLAGQHRLGARYGTSVVILGLGKMLLAVFFGHSAMTLLDAVPEAVLGVMLAIAGQELAVTGYLVLIPSVEEEEDDDDDEGSRKKRKKKLLRERAVVSIVTAIVIVALGKTHYGALSGWVTHMVYGDGIARFRSWLSTRKQSQETSSQLDETVPTDSPGGHDTQ